MNLENRVLEHLSRKDVVAGGGILLEELGRQLDCDKNELRDVVRNLLHQGAAVGVPDKKAGEWHLKYYVPMEHDESVKERLEEVLTDLGVSSWVEVKLFRGWKVIMIGDIKSKPGLTIIDYGKIPPLTFRSRLAGGEPNEITDFKKRSKFRCAKEGMEYWYGYHGKPHTDH